MRIGPTFNVAYRALRRNKMRSVLTALGIIIGVGAVIAMVAIGTGPRPQGVAPVLVLVGTGNGARARVDGRTAIPGEGVTLFFPGSTTGSKIGAVRGGA